MTFLKDFDQPPPKIFLRDLAIPVKKPAPTITDQFNDTNTQNSKSRKCPPVKEDKEKTMKRAGKRQRHKQEVEEEEIVKQPVFKKKHRETEREFLLQVDQETNDRLAVAQRKLKTTNKKRKKYKNN